MTGTTRPGAIVGIPATVTARQDSAPLFDNQDHLGPADRREAEEPALLRPAELPKLSGRVQFVSYSASILLYSTLKPLKARFRVIVHQDLPVPEIEWNIVLRLCQQEDPLLLRVRNADLVEDVHILASEIGYDDIGSVDTGENVFNDYLRSEDVVTTDALKSALVQRGTNDVAVNILQPCGAERHDGERDPDTTNPAVMDVTDSHNKDASVP
jgi:hypothetical protein